MTGPGWSRARALGLAAEVLAAAQREAEIAEGGPEAPPGISAVELLNVLARGSIAEIQDALGRFNDPDLAALLDVRLRQALTEWQMARVLGPILARYDAETFARAAQRLEQALREAQREAEAFANFKAEPQIR